MNDGHIKNRPVADNLFLGHGINKENIVQLHLPRLCPEFVFSGTMAKQNKTKPIPLLQCTNLVCRLQDRLQGVCHTMGADIACDKLPLQPVLLHKRFILGTWCKAGTINAIGHNSYLFSSHSPLDQCLLE